jgi:hypothetical protein
MSSTSEYIVDESTKNVMVKLLPGEKIVFTDGTYVINSKSSTLDKKTGIR